MLGRISPRRAVTLIDQMGHGARWRAAAVAVRQEQEHLDRVARLKQMQERRSGGATA